MALNISDEAKVQMPMKTINTTDTGIKKRNPIAKALKFFTPKVIRDKTKYRRKDVKFWKRDFWEWDGS